MGSVVAAGTVRVRHLLDCDATEPACRLDLDVYANSNFTEDGMSALRTSTLAQGLWGSAFAGPTLFPTWSQKWMPCG